MGGLGYGENHKHMDPSYRVSTLQAVGGGVMVWGVFSKHILGPLTKVEQRLNATGYLNIITNQMHAFMAAMPPSAIFFFQQDNAPCHQARLVQEWFRCTNMTGNSADCCVLPSHQISIQMTICGMRRIKLFRVEIHYQPIWHNCGKHWRQHGPASLWNAFDNL